LKGCEKLPERETHYKKKAVSLPKWLDLAKYEKCQTLTPIQWVCEIYRRKRLYEQFKFMNISDCYEKYVIANKDKYSDYCTSTLAETLNHEDEENRRTIPFKFQDDNQLFDTVILEHGEKTLLNAGVIKFANLEDRNFKALIASPLMDNYPDQINIEDKLRDNETPSVSQMDVRDFAYIADGIGWCYEESFDGTSLIDEIRLKTDDDNLAHFCIDLHATKSEIKKDLELLLKKLKANDRKKAFSEKSFVEYFDNKLLVVMDLILWLVAQDKSEHGFESIYQYQDQLYVDNNLNGLYAAEKRFSQARAVASDCFNGRLVYELHAYSMDRIVKSRN
jgi:hypothetical protein